MGKNRVIESSLETRNNTPPPENKALSKSIETLGLKKIQRHVFICADQTLPKCCSKQASLEAWEYLKKRLLRTRTRFSPRISSKLHIQNQSQLLASLLLWADNGGLPGWCLVSPSNPGSH
jgi:hypothetical protein